MRGHVHETNPPENTNGLDELVAVTAPDEADAKPDGPAAVLHLGEPRRALAPADLGPNGDVVLELLGRASRLTADECQRLDREAAWRWGMISPIPGVTTAPVARARALVRGRGDGRSEAIAALEAAVVAIVHVRPGRKVGGFLAASISNAGLAVLVRDLIESETFETLYGPWREVMHH